MALYFSLMATTTHGQVRIGHFSAVRVDGSANPESIGTYDVDIADTKTRWIGTVKHRYGDSAWELVAKALAVSKLGLS